MQILQQNQQKNPQFLNLNWDYRAAKRFWGASIQENNTNFGFRVVKSEAIKNCICHLTEKFHLYFGERINVTTGEGKNYPQCCLTFLDKPFFVFQNLYPCYRCILNELQKLYGFYGRQGSEAKCTILAYFFGDLPNLCFILKLPGEMWGSLCSISVGNYW